MKQRHLKRFRCFRIVTIFISYNATGRQKFWKLSSNVHTYRTFFFSFFFPKINCQIENNFKYSRISYIMIYIMKSFALWLHSILKLQQMDTVSWREKKGKLQMKFNTRNICQSQCLNETRHRLALHLDVVRAGSLASPPLMNARAKNHWTSTCCITQS